MAAALGGGLSGLAAAALDLPPVREPGKDEVRQQHRAPRLHEPDARLALQELLEQQALQEDSGLGHARFRGQRHGCGIASVFEEQNDSAM